MNTITSNSVSWNNVFSDPSLSRSGVLTLFLLRTLPNYEWKNQQTALAIRLNISPRRINDTIKDLRGKYLVAKTTKGGPKGRKKIISFKLVKELQNGN